MNNGSRKSYTNTLILYSVDVPGSSCVSNRKSENIKVVTKVVITFEMYP